MKINFALIGNPNSGLTTVFNQMTGGTQNQGFFSNSSMKTKEGPVRRHKGVNVIELPGTYSLSSYSADDISTRNILINGKPDVIINVVDATSLQRGLYLTLQLMELEIPIVLALNMMDEVVSNGASIDLIKLSEELTIPVVPISASKNDGIHDLIDCGIKTVLENKKPQKIDFCSGYVHTALHSISHLIEDDAKRENLPLRFCSSKIVEGDEPISKALSIMDPELKIIDEIVKDMENHLGTDREAAMADMRYSYIDNLYKKIVTTTGESKEHLRSIKMDLILTHKYFAIPIFLGIMFLVFWLTFGVIGAFFSDIFSIGINAFTNTVSDLLLSLNVSPALHSLIIDGVFAGVGSVISFLPIIAVLFFFLSILEDSGYMPRVAFVMDKLLRKLGLSGKSIVPMLIGFGCSVPAIMATRSLPSERDRRMTTMLIPFMSCSAKLPIYAIFTTAFFTEYRAVIMMCIYLTGIIVAIIIARILNFTVFNGNPVPFVMVLPSYRLPAAKSVWLRMWENVKGFIKKAFTVIFIATIVIWLLRSFDFGLNMVTSSEDSMLASLGRAAAPIFSPLGFGDWRAATALITGLSAKEAVVSTLAVLIGASDQASLSTLLTSIFTPLSAYAFLVFCLLYMPCVATLATVKREMGGWKNAILVVFAQTTIAWIVAFLIYKIGSFIISLNLF
ncbi:ferrous iron transport protein B [Anaerovorax odorimutans]|uniref:ferrous iron transport protein B n=1 Tax=Anaerovorax odorimutans TaxID=109327 RepID=UPI00040AD976|nr:ferrous iron transport protein B [Anaerovorax odorimutans]